MNEKPCEVVDGWCQRHCEKHIGRLLELSQMDNDLGRKYRMMWDRRKGERGGGEQSPTPNKGGPADASKKSRPCNCGGFASRKT